MPIRINLLAEAQAAEEMRRKDPVKRAIWIGGFLVFLIVLCAVTLQFKIMAARSDVNTLQASWKSIEKNVQEVNGKRNDTRELESRLSALDQFTTNRLLWAAALNAFQFTPVEGVQLVRLKANQAFTSRRPRLQRARRRARAEVERVPGQLSLFRSGLAKDEQDSIDEPDGAADGRKPRVCRLRVTNVFPGKGAPLV